LRGAKGFTDQESEVGRGAVFAAGGLDEHTCYLMCEKQAMSSQLRKYYLLHFRSKHSIYSHFAKYGRMLG